MNADGNAAEWYRFEMEINEEDTKRALGFLDFITDFYNKNVFANDDI
jgi:hypothetical protein